MKRTLTTHRLGRLAELIGSLRLTGVRAVLVYEDAVTKQWLEGVLEQLTASGIGPVSITWWKTGDLAGPGVLAGAVSKAIQAEIIAIAVRGSEGLPLPFYIWFNSWLPHQAPGRSVLVSLLGSCARPNAHSRRVRAYVQAAAERCGMDLVLEERALAADVSPPDAPWLGLASSSRVPANAQNRGRADGRRQSAAVNGVWSAPARAALAPTAGT